MSKHVNSLLGDWVRSLLSDVEVTHYPPEDSAARPAVNLYLMECAFAASSNTRKHSPLQVNLRYLVTTWADDIGEGQDMLFQLIFPAMENPDYRVDLNSIRPETWIALGLRPRPAFILEVPLNQMRPEPTVKRVEQMVLDQVLVTAVEGRVVFGPDETPVPDVRVSLPALKRVTRTTQSGQFRFDAVPSDVALRLKVRGQEFSATASQQPLVLRMKPT